MVFFPANPSEWLTAAITATALAMDLTSVVFTTILSPLAAFLPPSNPPADTTTPNPDPAPTPDSDPLITPTPWQTSPLNPQSRLNTLSRPPHPPKWHFSAPPPSPTCLVTIPATPTFTLSKSPLRVNIHLPPLESWPPTLRAAVHPEQAIYSRQPLADLPLGRYLTHLLARWEVEMGGEGEVERMWWGMPFGSVLSVDFGTPGEGQEGEVALVARYGVEQGMVSVEALKGMWGEAVRWEGVEIVEWEGLGLRRQVYEGISLVVIGSGVEERGREVVFKSVLGEQGYMYNELKMLLSLEPHPNVIARPLGVVTKKGRFGNRRGVCGFLLEWFPLGSLKEVLLKRDSRETISLAQKFRWAMQVIEALVHVNGHARAGFYPDLKPDNVVLRESAGTGMSDAVLIDLEQRGGWFAWSPPEVAYLEYLEVLVGDEGMPEGGVRDEILGQLREYYDDPAWVPEASSRRYQNADGGFSSPWLALLKERETRGAHRDLLERAQVFMLGKLLWCIFEGQPLVRCGIDHEVLRDADPEYESRRSGTARAFPEFRETPAELRELIRNCTVGAPEWEISQPRLPGVVLRSGKLCPAISGAKFGDVAAKDTQEAARRFWQAEVDRAHAFLKEVLLLRGKPQQRLRELTLTPVFLDQVQRRPLFSEVLGELKCLQARL